MGLPIPTQPTEFYLYFWEREPKSIYVVWFYSNAETTNQVIYKKRATLERPLDKAPKKKKINEPKK